MLFHLGNSRAKQALFPDVYDEDILRDVAKLAQGDARCALQCLRAAAFKAGENGAQVITPADVQGAWETLGSPHSSNGKAPDLNAHERLISDLVQQNQSIDSSSLREAYRQACEAARITPVAGRTFTDYLTHLLHLGVIELDELRSRGNTRAFMPARQRTDAEVDRQ